MNPYDANKKESINEMGNLDFAGTDSIKILSANYYNVPESSSNLHFIKLYKKVTYNILMNTFA